MAKFIKVKTTDGVELYVNADKILYIEPRYEGGKIYLSVPKKTVVEKRFGGSIEEHSVHYKVLDVAEIPFEL